MVLQLPAQAAASAPGPDDATPQPQATGGRGPRSGPLRDVITSDIRAQISSGKLQPGDRLVERDLAEEFNVSRLPVREALRTLRRDNLVEDLPTRGVVVKRLQRREVEEIFDIRESLETLASRAAAEQVLAGAHSTLHVCVEQSRLACTSGDLDAAHAANSQFHDEIIDLSGNHTLQTILAPLMWRLHWVFRQVLDVEQVCREHDELAAAIEAGEPKRAALEAQLHVLSYRKRTLSHLYG